MDTFPRIRWAVAITALVALVAPSGEVHAQTSGPTQPEFQSISGTKAGEIVDPFTGDLRYTISLFDLPGPNGSFPFVLEYSSGFGPAQEASWVGLGWSLNPGLISRQMRGLPDDMNGESIRVTKDALPNWTFGTGGAIGLEVFGADPKISLGFGIRGYYNNYQGVGVTKDFSAAYSMNKSGPGLNGTVGLSLSLDSHAGPTLTPSMGIGYAVESDNIKYNSGGSLSASVNSRTGLGDLQLGWRYSTSIASKNAEGKPSMDEDGKPMKPGSISAGGGSTIWNFAQPGRSPTIGRDVEGWGVNAHVKLGFSGFGAFTTLTFSGFVQKQALANRREAVGKPGFGYLYLHAAADDEDAVMDFFREKDGQIRKKTPNLPIPILTNDLYLASGQGFAGTFRAFRNDAGILGDPKYTFDSWAVTAGFEVGVGGYGHYGGDASGTWTNGTSGRWKSENELANELSFRSPGTSPLTERVYFAMLGEQAIASAASDDALTNIAGENAVKFDLVATDDAFGSFTSIPPTYPKFIAKRSYVATGGGTGTIQQVPSDRHPRATVIAAFTNSQIREMAGAAPELNPEFIDSGSTTRQVYSRTNLPGSHIGAFVVTTPDGMRHIYALPVYNLTQTDVRFSSKNLPVDSCGPTVAVDTHLIDGTEQFLDSTSMPAYTTAHLLTAVLGPDYVDADLIPGPSDGDFGYWVKFTYQRTTKSYVWRAPYTEAAFDQGYRNEGYLSDDKGSFIWGTKELYYLRSAETKTHIAEFVISDRRDAAGAYGERATSGPRGHSEKLDRIDLFSKADKSHPLKRVHFAYKYDLAEGIPNFDASNAVVDKFQVAVRIDDTTFNSNTSRPGTGKLALRRLWFENERSTRGKASPYDFGYDAAGPSNPRFKSHAQDRWGVYRDFGDFCEVAHFPYVKQDPASVAARDIAASAWHLRRIKLPAGGQLEISYESDRYGWVQNRRAMQMVPIRGVDESGGSTIPDDAKTDVAHRRLYFPLRDTTADPNAAAAQLARYTDGVDQLYFKACVDLKEAGDGACEFVAGYAEVAGSGLAATVNNQYREGWISLNTSMGYHPISVAAWQHLRLNQPDLLEAKPFGINANGSAAGQASKLLLLVDFLSSADMIFELFQGFNERAWSNDWGKKIYTDKSWIRLNVPTHEKLGGGVRVSRVLLIDNWHESTSTPERPDTLGQVFHYILPDGSSSGVADYEPTIGGDENPFRRANSYNDDLWFASDYNLFFEDPINESYFPGLRVGYSRVVIRSFASERLRLGQLPTGTPTLGESVRTFYTAKDFPVTTAATTINRKDFKIPAPLLLMGWLTIDNLTASQGYAIQLNDMHGKPRTVEEYEGNPDGSIRPGPLSSVEYKYYATGSNVESDRVQFTLDGTVPTLQRPIDEINGVLTPHMVLENRVLGRQVDFFVDMRESRTETAHLGVAGQVDLIPILGVPTPVGSGWPLLDYSLSVTRTVVSNKVIFRSGILKEVVSNKEGAITKSANLAFDPLGGRSLLTAVLNAFEDSTFSLAQPARWFFDAMGAAYSTVGTELAVQVAANNTGNRMLVKGASAQASSDLADYVSVASIGDELAISAGGKPPTRARVVELNAATGTMVVDPEDAVTDGSVNLRLLRSGHRNLLDVDASQLRALSNPIAKKRYNSCVANYVYPCKSTKRNEASSSKRPSPQAERVFAAFADVRATRPRGSPMSLSVLEGALDFCWNSTRKPGSYPGGDSRAVNLAALSIGAVMRVQLRTGRALEGRLVSRRRGTLTMNVAAERPNREARTTVIKQGDVRAASALGSNGNWVALPTVTTGTGALRDNPLAGPTGDCDNTCDWSLLDSAGRAIPKEVLESFAGAYAVQPPPNGIQTDPNTQYGYSGLAAIVVYQGRRIEVTIYSNCSGWTSDGGDPSPQELCVKSDTVVFEMVDSVLSINGTRFSGAWPQSYEDVQFIGTPEDVAAQRDALTSANAFANGEQGNWRAQRMFSYLDVRNQTTPSVNIRRDGTFNDVTLFDGGSEKLLECAAKWRPVTEVVRYDPHSFATETVDQLKIPTAALYGYGGSLNTAFAKNARYDEIGFDGLEEYQLGQDVGPWNRAAGNIDLYTRATTQFVTVELPSFTIGDAYQNRIVFDPRVQNSGVFGGSSPFVRNARGFNNTQVDSVEIIPTSRLGPMGAMDRTMPAGGRYPVTSLGNMSDGRIFMDLQGWRGYTPTPDGGVGGMQPPRGTVPPIGDPTREILEGKVKIFVERYGGGIVQIPRRVGTVDIVSTKAHTGRQSFMVAEPDSFPQPRLHLDSLQKYVFEAWVSRDTIDVPTFKRATAPNVTPLGVEVQFLDEMNVVIGRHPLAEPEGPIVEGWQRIETVFTMPLNVARIALKLQTGTDATGKNTKAYFDDFRVFPADANIETYVYDPATYRMSALLDNNNFARLFGYDDEGVLQLVRQETVRGIMTVQETRMHLRERP